jgi:hypothetical protein
MFNKTKKKRLEVQNYEAIALLFFKKGVPIVVSSPARQMVGS